MIRNNEKNWADYGRANRKTKKVSRISILHSSLEKRKKKFTLFLSANVVKEILIQKPVYKYWKKDIELELKYCIKMAMKHINMPSILVNSECNNKSKQIQNFNFQKVYVLLCY